VCQGDGAFFLTYCLTDAAGQVCADGTVRTMLPVDIPAGRGITIPLWISPPEPSGHYTIDIRLDQSGKDWQALPHVRKEIEVRPDWGSMVPAHWLTLHRLPETYNYQIDHEIGRVFLKEEMARADRPAQRVLEIGGCCNPMTWDLPCEVISADIDVQTLQVGALRFSTFRPNVEFLAADAHRLPFADGVFDCAVMFATLHHFLDPAACLKELMRVVRDGGFVTILCEPIGSYHAETLSAEFKADLEQGINEQIFTPEEYGHIFARAGVEATRAVIDGGSFKAVLRRCSAAPHAAAMPPAPPLAVVDAALGAPSQSWLANRLKAIFFRS
jgi:ubiquinone/menaquinone biosynthesis C-methylase UbiE